MSSRARRFTLRARIALAYSVLLSITGALMLGGVYLFMRYVPAYSLSPVANLNEAGVPAALTSADVEPATEGPTNTVPSFVSPVVNSTNDVFTLLLGVSIGVFVLLAVVGAAAGWVIAGRMLQPLQAINRVAKSAASGDLSQRIDSDGPHDELHDLSQTLDDMLARLKRSVGEHQRFAANASHELRTPIATTQTLLDIALTTPDLDLPTLRKTAERVREMNQRNRETVESLLALANADGGQLRKEPVRIDELAEAAVYTEHSGIDDAQLSVEAHTMPAAIIGDPSLLRQAVGNLIQNAVRHNNHGGDITIIVESSSTEILLRVENTGAALPDSVVETLTEPFVRGQGRVAGSVKGHGLGLTLARSVTEAHHGHLTLAARDGGGLIVDIRFPPTPQTAKQASAQSSPPTNSDTRENY